MNRVKPIQLFVCAMLSLFLLIFALAGAFAQNRTRTPGPFRGGAAVQNLGPHEYRGNLTRVPPSITKRQFKPTRAAGDQQASRQTILLTPTTPNGTTPTPAQEEHPFWTNDEATLYFDSDRKSATDGTEDPNHGFNIYSMNPDGTNVTQIAISTVGNKLDPAASQNGQLLAYVASGSVAPAQSSDAAATTGFNLFYVPLSGTPTPVQLTDTGSGNNFNFTDVRHPIWAPTGDRIVFAGKLAPAAGYHIFIVNVNSGAVTQITDGPANDYAPSWSADGNFIAFTSNATTFTAVTPLISGGRNAWDDIWVAATTGTPNPTRVTGFSANGAHASNKNPAWSSHTSTLINTPSNLLAFASTRADSDPNQPGVPVSVVNTFDIYFMEIGNTPTAPSGNDTAVKLQTSTPGTGIDQTELSVGFDPGHTTNEDYPAWPQFVNSYRIAYQSDKFGELDLFASTVVDISAPTLVIYDIPSREIVHTALDATPDTPQRQFAPGDKVRFRVKIADYESGVAQGGVFIQIKNPNSAPQSADGIEHKIFDPESRFMDGSPTSPTTVFDVPNEFDEQAINVRDYTYRAPVKAKTINLGAFEPDKLWPAPNQFITGDDFTAFSGSSIGFSPGGPPPDSFWLGPLTQTSPGVWEGTWQTPSTPSDWYIDVIAFDNAVDPFDPTQKYNWKIYDNVWGFTTQTFSPKNPILYVNDYDAGQKFFNSRFGTGTNFGFPVGQFTDIQTESWMTEIDKQYYPHAYIPSGANAKVGTFITSMFYPDFQFSVENTVRATLDDKSSSAINDTLLVGPYDQWRVLSRGPIPPLILNQYGAHMVTQPPDLIAKSTTARTITVAPRFVIWHSPYSGDLLVGNGTIIDAQTQLELQSFVQSGGRLFLDGQDIAWALTQGGSVPNAFLSNIFKANFVLDNIMPLYEVRAGGEPNAKIALAGTRGTNPISMEPWYADNIVSFQSAEFPGPGNPPPPESPPGSGNVGAAAYIGDPTNYNPLRQWSALNQYSADQVAFTATIAQDAAGVDGTYGGVATQPAIMWTVSQSGARYKTLFSPFGWEAIDPEQFAPAGSTGVFHIENRRTELMHNVSDFFRTGRVIGKIIDQSTTQPIQNVFVRITKFNPPVTYGTALTDASGNYVIDGVDAYGSYNIEAFKTGYSGHATVTDSFHGGEDTRVDFILSPATPGTISGKVTKIGTGEPIAGATVQATESSPADPKNPLTFTGVTGTDGTYTIKNVPVNSVGYNITVAPLAHYKTTTLNGKTVADSVPPQYANVTVATAQNVTGQDFQLKPLPGHITGKVTKADANGVDTGVGLPGVTVTATGAGNVTFTATTDANGNYNITADPGQYDVTAAVLGYTLKAKVPVTVQTEVTTPNINLIMVPIPPGTLAVRVHTSPTTNSANGVAVTGATVTVKDANGNVIATGTTGAEQSAGGPNFSVSVPAGSTVTVTAQKNGYNNNQPSNPVTVSIASNQTATADITIDPLHTFDNTLSLVSAPFEYTTDITRVFGINPADVTSKQFEFVTWGTTNYISYPHPPADTFHRGIGYFLADTSNNATLTITSTDPQTGPTDNFPIHLKAGWNLIGDPFNYSVNFQALQVVDNGVTTDVITAQSGSNPALGAALWTYAGGTYQVTFTIDPWRGYWLRAYRPVDLIIGSSAKQNRAAKLTTRGTILDGNIDGGWKLDLTASAGTIKSAPGIVGINRSAVNTYDRFKLEAPPAVGPQGVTLTFSHTDWGDKSGKYSVDMRSALATAQSWQFTVGSNVPNTPVTLNWPDVATVPGKYDLVLTDLDTNVTTRLRNRTSYVIPASRTAITRHFQLDVKRATRQILQITDLEAQVNRSGGRAPTSVGISYNLTADATVQITILQNGRHVRTLDGGATRAAGAADVTWDLKNDEGLVVPGNAYTVEVRAADNDGRVVRRITPLLITR